MVILTLISSDVNGGKLKEDGKGRGQKTEVRGQRAEVKGQRSEIRGRPG